MVRGAVGDEAVAMTETALQYVTALHPDRNGVTPDGGRAGAEKQRMQQRCSGVNSVAHFDRAARAPAARARGRASAAADFGGPVAAR
jgi:hypothetical protein